MSLPPTVAIDILESASDNEITTSEVSELMYQVFNAGLTGLVLVFSATAFIKAVQPPKKEAGEILEIAEML